MEFISIGKCLKVKRAKGQYFYWVHFKGVMGGEVIKSIILEGNKEAQELNKERDYIIHARLLRQHGQTLYGKILRVKTLDIIRSDFL